MDAKIRALKQRIKGIKRQVATIGDMRPGTLSEQYNVCGTAGCRCKADPPRKHGPYSQLSWTRKRKSRTRFVSSSNLATVKTQLANYERLNALLDQWIELSIELHDFEFKAKAKQK